MVMRLRSIRGYFQAYVGERVSSSLPGMIWSTFAASRDHNRIQRQTPYKRTDSGSGVRPLALGSKYRSFRSLPTFIDLVLTVSRHCGCVSIPLQLFTVVNEKNRGVARYSQRPGQILCRGSSLLHNACRPISAVVRRWLIPMTSKGCHEECVVNTGRYPAARTRLLNQSRYVSVAFAGNEKQLLCWMGRTIAPHWHFLRAMEIG